VSRYAKSIAAFLTALAGWGTTALADGHLEAGELFGLALVAGTALNVFAVPNTPPDGIADPTVSETDPIAAASAAESTSPAL
jgi:hypothetical protein